MKIKEIRDKQTAAIELEMKDLHKHLFELRTQAVTEKLENPSLLRKTRKDIARMKTILRERQLAEKNGQEKKQPEKPKVKIKKVRVKLARTTKSQGKRKRKKITK
jgi:large subunit ribosomal protein L29